MVAFSRSLYLLTDSVDSNPALYKDPEKQFETQADIESVSPPQLGEFQSVTFESRALALERRPAGATPVDKGHLSSILIDEDILGISIAVDESWWASRGSLARLNCGRC